MKVPVKGRNCKHWRCPRLGTAKIGLLSKESERRIRQSLGHAQSVFFLETVSCCNSRANNPHTEKDCTPSDRPRMHWPLVPSNPRCSGNPLTLCVLLPSSPTCDLRLAWFIFQMMIDDLITEIKARISYKERSQIWTKGQGWSPFLWSLNKLCISLCPRGLCGCFWWEKNELREDNA